VIVNVIGILPY